MSLARINTLQLVSDCQGDQQSANLRLESFCERGLQLLDLIEISISDANWAAVEDLTDQMQRALQSIGADSVANLAKALVSQPSDNEKKAWPAFLDLQREIDSLVREIETYFVDGN